MPEKLDLKLEIYLPAKYDSDDEFQRNLIRELTETFRGLTIIPNCDGKWVKVDLDGKKHVMHDNITKIEIFSTKAEFNGLEFHKAFYKAIRDIKGHYAQHSVAFTINDAMEFY